MMLHISLALSYVLIVVNGSVWPMIFRQAECRETACEDVQRLVMSKSSQIL